MMLYSIIRNVYSLFDLMTWPFHKKYCLANMATMLGGGCVRAGYWTSS
jgi:hypothetical protein